MSTDAAASSRSQTDVVIDGITGMISRGELRPGSRLPIEKDLAVQFAVSRGSLREGVRALAALGVLETRQGDGTYVTALDPASLLSPLGFLAELQQPAHAADLLAVRRILETESAARAAIRMTDDELAGLDDLLGSVEAALDDGGDIDLEDFIRADAEFHSRIAQAAGNPPMAAMIDALVGRTFRARLWRAISHRGSVAETQAEHRAILAELVRRDPERARIRMSVHLLGVEQFSAEHAAEDPEAPRV
ncbi:FadR family transcriptional regulator [Microbacterium sp. W1N]|uniref:FadR/GntR family transcriptional regulator n=1 Tax=Microbacterium festucae TaxID=2977531 RepID=UPI0021C1D492|nr:FadR/GntR family transcriptional regulator [Microbacterium festucae]MCT9819610.1 FadR family transcriptional regulator [Microbacterium festucae]